MFPDVVTMIVHWTITILSILWLVCTAITTVARAVPADQFTEFERDFPRLGHLARAVRKFATDFQPFVREILAAAGRTPPPPVGAPFPVPMRELPTIPPPPRTPRGLS